MTIDQFKYQLDEIVADYVAGRADVGRYSVEYASDPQFGDYATNAAMVFAKQVGLAPRDLAQKIADSLKKLDGIKAASVAGPGFINVTLTDEVLAELVAEAPSLKPDTYHGQEVVTEYSDPNPFKVLHVGHFYTSVVGDAITNLIRLAGGKVHSVNFGGDVGLHVGKTLWAILQELGGELPEKLTDISVRDRSGWMSRCYVVGTRAYEDDEAAKAQIIALNKRVYQIVGQADHQSALAQVYWTCRGWSYDYFDQFYARIGTHFEKYYPESQTTPIGMKVVLDQQAKGVYKKSDGAVIFDGEPYGLHARVFITSQGLPTYEAKDVGLIMAKWRDYHFDRSVVITGNDIIEYMKVVLKSIEQYEPELVKRTLHITHGNVKLAGGVKMSSRKGNFISAVEVLDAATEASKRVNNQSDDQVVTGAVKYAFLKSRIGADLVYTPEDSVSLEGNSGPYLQYAHARARSVLVKASGQQKSKSVAYQVDERLLARKITEYPGVIREAAAELLPHNICTYLYELAQVFNRFYEKNRVINDEREAVRIELVAAYADILKDGLGILGIAAPDRL